MLHGVADTRQYATSYRWPWTDCRARSLRDYGRLPMLARHGVARDIVPISRRPRVPRCKKLRTMMPAVFAESGSYRARGDGGRIIAQKSREGVSDLSTLGPTRKHAGQCPRPRPPTLLGNCERSGRMPGSLGGSWGVAWPLLTPRTHFPLDGSPAFVVRDSRQQWREKALPLFYG